MENHDKMCAEISTGNTPNTLQSIRPICPNQPLFRDIFEKKIFITCPLSMTFIIRVQPEIQNLIGLLRH